MKLLHGNGYVEKVLSLLSPQVSPGRGQSPFSCLSSAGPSCQELTLGSWPPLPLPDG